MKVSVKLRQVYVERGVGGGPDAPWMRETKGKKEPAFNSVMGLPYLTEKRRVPDFPEKGEDMRNLAIAVVVVFFLVGASHAGEENLMAMRGRHPDGSIPVNHFNARRAGGENTPQTTSRDTTGTGYVGWKDTCARTRIHLSDRTVEWSGDIDFGMTPRFVAKREESGSGASLGLLVRELMLGGVRERTPE